MAWRLDTDVTEPATGAVRSALRLLPGSKRAPGGEVRSVPGSKPPEVNYQAHPWTIYSNAQHAPRHTFGDLADKPPPVPQHPGVTHHYQAAD